MKTWNNLALENELANLRLRWKEARDKGDLVMAKLWERLGKKLQKQLKGEE